MSPSSILHSRQIISSINYSEAKDLSEKVLSFTKIEEIKAFLEISSKNIIKTKE
jgi:phosphoenolpyruvate-protein kinase (PTS system EI component)